MTQQNSGLFFSPIKITKADTKFLIAFLQAMIAVDAPVSAFVDCYRAEYLSTSLCYNF
jgi:hypothetical protein